MRGRLVADCDALVADEVAAKSGLSGLAIKTSYAVVKKLRAGFIAEVIDRKLIDTFVDQLEPFYLQAGAAQVGFVDYLPAHGGEVANALLAITDRIAERTDNGVVRSVYGKLRPTGVKHVEAAVPAIAKLVVSHL